MRFPFFSVILHAAGLGVSRAIGHSSKPANVSIISPCDPYEERRQEAVLKVQEAAHQQAMTMPAWFFGTRSVATGIPYHGDKPNQRKVRKQRRRAWAAGDRHAFSH